VCPCLGLRSQLPLVNPAKDDTNCGLGSEEEVGESLTRHWFISGKRRRKEEEKDGHGVRWDEMGLKMRMRISVGKMGLLFSPDTRLLQMRNSLHKTSLLYDSIMSQFWGNKVWTKTFTHFYIIKHTLQTLVERFLLPPSYCPHFSPPSFPNGVSFSSCFLLFTDLRSQ